MKQETKATIRFFTRQVKNHRLLTVAMLLCLNVGLASEMYLALILKVFFDALTQPGTKDFIAGILVSNLLQVLIFDVLNFISMRSFSYCVVFFETGIMAEVLNQCFEYLHGHSYNFFNQNFSGALVKRVNRMADAFEGIADRILFDFYPIFFKLIVISVVLYCLHPLLGIIMFIWGVIFITLNYLLSKYKLKYDLISAEADTKVTAVLSDTITNSVNIKLFAGLKNELKNYMKTTREWGDKTRTAWLFNNHVDAFQALFMVILEVGMLFAAIKLWQQNILTVGDFFLIQIYLMDMFRQLWGLGRSIRDLYKNLANANEMMEILITPHAVKNKKGARSIKISSGKVEFDKVVFSYGESEDSVVKNLSFKITPGEKIALIGPSGGGKSTITKLLLRLYDIQKGKILIDQQDISKVTQESLRSQIALVPQDPILFHRTLMENIRYGRPEASDQEVIFASKMAYCHDFIGGFNKGYQTYVGERGVRLSGGQRQRVAIARAILSNAKILVLDEATSSLDSESETLIQAALKNLIKNKTTFIIAHRLSTIMEVDRIFVLKNGSIIEEGQHADLVNKKGSLYGKLWKIQVGGFMGEK